MRCSSHSFASLFDSCVANIVAIREWIWRRNGCGEAERRPKNVLFMWWWHYNNINVTHDTAQCAFNSFSIQKFNSLLFRMRCSHTLARVQTGDSEWQVARDSKIQYVNVLWLRVQSSNRRRRKKNTQILSHTSKAFHITELWARKSLHNVNVYK